MKITVQRGMGDSSLTADQLTKVVARCVKSAPGLTATWDPSAQTCTLFAPSVNKSIVYSAADVWKQIDPGRFCVGGVIPVPVPAGYTGAAMPCPGTALGTGSCYCPPPPATTTPETISPPTPTGFGVFPLLAGIGALLALYLVARSI